MVSPATSINVTGNVEGSIVIGDNNFVVNNNHGTIVYKQAGPQARLRDLAPRPPRAPRAFVGRECELQELAEWVDKRQPVLLEGIDGVGKTTLLKQAANSQAAQNIKNGVVYLEGIDQSGTALAWEDIRQLLFDALFESDPQLKVNAASARTYLSNTSPLVLLDNLQLDEEALEDLADLFPQSPIIAVSTKRMDSDVFERYPIDPLPPGEAIDLLATRAKLTVDDTNRAALEKLTASLNYLPLTLVTVGNAIREYKLSLEQALVGLNAIQVAGAHPIKVAIERSILFAQSFLSSEERQMLGLAAAAPAISTSREFLEKTSGGAAVSTQLENLSLLQANSPRLRLHPEYAPFVLQNSDIAVVRFKLASAIMDGINARPLDFDFIKAELGNLLGLIEWSASQGNSAEVFKMARATFPYVVLHGLWDAWRRIMEFVLKAARHVGDQVQEAWALHELGTRMIGTGELTGAEIALRQALKLRQDLGDTEGAAYTLHNLDYLKKQGAVPPESGETTPVTTRRRPALFRWIVIGLILLLLLLCISTAGLARAGAITLPPGMTWLAGMPAPSPTPTQTLTPTFTLTPSPTSTATSTATHTMTPTSTFTLTPTVTPSPTATQTPTLTPTPTITVTPTITGTLTATPFAFPTFTAKMQAYCNYGPGPVPLYLPAADIFPGDTGTVHGRNATSTWLYVQLDKNQRYCWAATSTLDVTGDIKTVNITQTKLPFSPQSPPPTGITATRKGDQVTITWDPMPVAARDFRGYLLTVNTCVNGLRTPQIVQTNNTSYVFTDGNNCSGTSKGQIQSVTVQGYSNPVPIEPWP